MVIMEIVGLGKEFLQSVAEYVVSYKFGQTILRQVDRTLWVIEKSARWAVPPPLEQDERPPPELVRPLPWVLFLAMLIALRITRESISLVNLVMGKPPLRSADVVSYIQSKRRYLRTLKYQGSRMMRARDSSSAQSRSWYEQLRSLATFTMCLSNNRTTCARDDVMMINCDHRAELEDVGAAAANAGRSMEKLIEKMMTDLRAESDDDDDSFTHTNVNSTKSSSESEQDTAYNTDVSTTNSGGVATSTPIRPPADFSQPTGEENINNNTLTEKLDNIIDNETTQKTSPAFDLNLSNERSPDKNGDTSNAITPKELSQKFIQNETNNKTQPQKKTKIANGRARKTSATRNREYAKQ